ncbi:permease [Massilia violaceinigra]|uniref:Permease n=1 Tax=Massilia violaceinigra TaxID=2045208 RepID=A0A2D2DPT2_9BURK|nr:permease [Massilia violaceinigra]ATQ76978.1 permease [Massilia violaceinigra]
MQRTLSLEQSPPLGAVLRYFLATPVFALLAGALLLWQGAPALASRWSPSTLALTHLLTLGTLGMAMAGALIQILPVVAGVTLPRARLLAPGVHALLAGGTAALAGAFLFTRPWLFQLALALLLPGFAWLIGALTVALWQMPPPGALPMTATVRLALGSLLVTVCLGALLAGAFAWPASAALLPLMLATDVHALWGVFGWAGLLLVGVSFQVVPMFQVTPLYDKPLPQMLGVTIFLLLVVWTVSAAALRAHLVWIDTMASTLLLASYALFALATLRLLARRKRPQADAMTLFWRLAMASMLACATLWAVPAQVAGDGRTLAMGVLMLVGFLYSTINGMLYKIVPFLIWRDLQERAADGQRVPTIKTLTADQDAQRQFWLHAAALALLVAACWWPVLLARPAAAAMCLSAVWLLLNLSTALRRARNAVASGSSRTAPCPTS